MEDQLKDSAATTETEEFPDDFRCSVCLDLLYKPVVLACGHISCFWCVFNAMDTSQESHCPVCRHPYNHFPSICQLLHFLLLKKYPLVYKRREGQVIEEEKKMRFFSPQFDDHLSGSDLAKGFDKLGGISPQSTDSADKLYLQSCSEGNEKCSLKDSSETIVPEKDYKAVATTLSCEANRNVTAQDNKRVCEPCNEVIIADFLCAGCKQLLCRPVVLNCGHVYCEACVINPSNNVSRCQICGSVHPNGFPKVCLVLDHFLEEQFSKEYAVRKETVLKNAHSLNGSPSTSSKAQDHAGRSLTNPPNLSSSQSDQDTKVHDAVGCDFCGMYPIIGERYKCEDCVEVIGFDLCESCYNSSSKLPGRFNQQHKPEHKFKIVEPYIMDNIIWRYTHDSEEDFSDDHEDLEDVSSVSNASGDDLLDIEDGSTAAISEDQEADRQL